METEKVVYEEVDVEEEDNDDEPFAYSAPTHKKTNKSKKLTKTDAESLAIELLNGRLKPLNQPSETNWLDIVPTLDSIFEELEPSVKDELVHQLCIHLVIDVDYDKNILLLERFFADIDQDGVCINDSISRPTFKLLSLIYNANDIVWAKDAKATFAKSKEIKSQFDSMKQTMPADSTPAEIMKAVNKLIFKNAKAASLTTDKTMTMSACPPMTMSLAASCPMTSPSLLATKMSSCPPMTMRLPSL